MILSDTAIRQLKPFEPWDDQLVQPASYEVTLGDEVVFLGFKFTFTDNIELKPGEFALATTVETITVPADLVAQVNGKSSWARRGLIVHTTAGFIDPGFTGQITLELANLGHEPIQLKAGQRIAQIVFTRLDQPAAKPYGHPDLGNHYQNQQGVTENRWKQ